MIPHETIDEVRQAADIVDIISDYLTLRQTGRSFKALSPFTQEKTPSFVVSPEKQIYKCFSTGKGGNVFSFVMEMEKVSFPEAVELVAKRSGMDISRFTSKNDAEDAKKDTRTDTLRWAARHFHSALEADHGSSGYAYLAAERGLSAATIKSFGLGYAPPGWDHLLHAAKKAGIEHKHLESLGLITENRQKKSWYDTFRNRVIFPIFSIGGQVVGFGGRTLEKSSDTPKYLNSQESSIFEKSKLLYGLNTAKNEIRTSGEAILVEGYMDVLALHQAGITSAVASCGTSLTRYQAKIIGRYAKSVLFVYDADPAGKKSMMAGIDILLSENITPVILMLPPGDDPDSFVKREGREKFLAFARKESLSFLDFQIRFHQDAGAFRTPELKADAIGSMARTIGLTGDPVRRELYLQELSEKIGISLQALHEVLPAGNSGKRESAPPPPPGRPKQVKPVNTGPISVLEKTFVKALLESTAYGNVVLEFAASHEAMLTLRNPAAQHIFLHMIRRYHEISADPDARIDVATEIGLFGRPDAEDLATGLLMDQPVSNKWLEKTDLHGDSARRCLGMFLDAFKNLILEPLLDEKDRLTEAIRTEVETEKEIALSREKITLDKKIRTTALELSEMISAILERRQ